MIISGQVFPSLTSLTWLMVTWPQISVTLTALISGAGTSAKHSTVIGGGQVITGGIFTCTVMICTFSVVIPQSSVRLQVRVIITSPQSSAAETTSL